MNNLKLSKEFQERQKRIKKTIKEEAKKMLQEQRIKNGYYHKLTFLILIILNASLSLFFIQIQKTQDISIQKIEELARIEEQQIVEQPLTTQEIIRLKAIEYGVDVKTALDIAECESQFGKYNYNWQGSSAKGVYHFIDKTWNNYCSGDVLNEVDNINCFMKLYNEHKDWWSQCNVIIKK